MREAGAGSGYGRGLLLVVLLCGALTAGCSPTYVLRAGYEEAKILSRRRSIAKLVQDSTVPPEQRAKLSLVLEVRQFAADSLDLAVGKSYTTFSQLDSDTLVLVLSAAHRDRFQAHTWWFPIVGNVPYKGFFSERRAREAMRNLEAKGFDTYLRPTSAFSTLGWFNDPLVSSLLRYDSVSLAATVVHEVFHNTLYLAGQAMFNESLAEFVGNRGAIQFLCGRFGAGSRECGQARALWRDELIFGRHLSGLVSELETLYARGDLDAARKLELREEVFRRSAERFRREVQPQFEVASYASFAREPLNNATLISRRLYYHRLDLFEEVFRASGGDLRRTLRAILDAVEGAEDPYAAVEAVLAKSERVTGAALPCDPAMPGGCSLPPPPGAVEGPDRRRANSSLGMTARAEAGRVVEAAATGTRGRHSPTPSPRCSRVRPRPARRAPCGRAANPFARSPGSKTAGIRSWPAADSILPGRPAEPPTPPGVVKPADPPRFQASEGRRQLRAGGPCCPCRKPP